MKNNDNPKNKQESTEAPLPSLGKIPLGTRPKRRPGFLASKNLLDYETKDVFVAPRTRLLPAWFLPLVMLVLVASLVFWILPRQLAPKTEVTIPGAALPVERDEHAVVVKVSSADVFDSPFLRGKRLTQVLYNEPLTIIDASPPNHLGVELSDKTRGYVLRSAVSADTRSVTPTTGMQKIVVIASTKSIMSAASSGVLLAEAPMGSVLYSDYQSDLVMRLILPTGDYGWITFSNDVLLLGTDEAVTMPDNFIQSFTSSAMTFYNARWMPGGQTISGISPEGIARIAGLLNGVTLPHTLEKLAESGHEVKLPVNAETGSYDLRYLREGDLVFFFAPDAKDTIDSMAICMPQRQWMRTEQNRAAIRLVAIADQPDMASLIFKVVRLVED